MSATTSSGSRESPCAAMMGIEFNRRRRPGLALLAIDFDILIDRIHQEGTRSRSFYYIWLIITYVFVYK